MSLDFSIYAVRETEVFESNITHNLGRMALEADIYEALWRPDELGVETAGELIEPLSSGLEKLKANPEHFEQFNASNGWGLYEHFVCFVERALAACKEYPDGRVKVSR
jgi:hypothetical protein